MKCEMELEEDIENRLVIYIVLDNVLEPKIFDLNYGVQE